MTISKKELADALGVNVRTITTWVQDGCPTAETEENGERRFVLEDVRRWAAARGVGRRVVPAEPAATPSAEAHRPPITSKDAGQRADAARKIAQARQQELELAQERGLKDLDLSTRIRAVTTADEVVRIDLEVAALVAGGDMKHQRGQTLRQLLAQAHRALAEREAGASESKALYLVTAQARELAQAFDKIVNGWRRRWLVEAVALHLAEDMKELPGWDGDMQPVLAALQIDAMGEPVSSAWPTRFAPPLAAPALVTPPPGGVA